MTDKILFSGTTHTVGGAEGYARSIDGNFEIELPDRYRISPQVAPALRAVPGVVEVELV